ncbi:transketolase family protein [Catellatospora methionotrophica]|uniref:transketolase family protein n=1 Tax=Catellatospora methionotrophica TaxID=121620 RepID=UPI0033FBF129
MREARNMRPVVAEVLAELGAQLDDLVMVTADARALSERFERRHPARAIDVGIAEANLVGVAAGLARGTRRVVVAAMAPFLLRRAAEQIRLDVCRPGLDVTLIGVGGGLSYGSLGATHHVTEDLAAMSTMPGIRVYCPADVHDAAWAVRDAVLGRGPAYVRLGAREDQLVYEEHDDFSAERPRLFGGPAPVLIVTTGPTVAEAIEAMAAGAPAQVLAMTTVTPFPTRAILELACAARAVLVVEDQLAVGGLASRVASVLAGSWQGQFAALNVDDRPAPPRDRDGLFQFYGIDAAAIARKARELAFRPERA